MRKHFLAAASIAVLGLLPSGAIFADVGPAEQAIETLEARRLELVNSNQKIWDTADAAGSDVSDKDLETIESNGKEIEKIDRQIQARKLSLQLNAGAGRRTVADPQAAARPAGSGGRVVLNPRDQARWGFNNFGQLAQAVANHYRGDVTDDVTRLRNAATTYGNEGVGGDGGFLVAPGFSERIWQKVEAEENLLNRCAPLQTDGNSMMIPKDESTPWDSTGGIQVLWDGEGQSGTPSKPVFELGNLRLNKLRALVPVSEELLSDASGLESWLMVKTPGKMAAKINTAIVAGTGGGQPLGIIPGYTAVGASVVQVSKETSQPADTIWFANINKMWGRMYAGWRRNAVWLINQDIEAQLEGMAFVGNGITPTAASSTPAYMPPGGLADAPYGRLKGRPVIPLEACSALGDLGDIILVDLNQYWALKKAGGLETSTSIHLYFDQDLTTFKFIFRVTGQPAWSSTIARQNGGNTLSWAVALQAR
jgi:HK97 family phage major capsid protein